jgi:4-amino-4-deoxy-L-arabinose transferase-like glycosyltransferase
MTSTMTGALAQPLRRRIILNDTLLLGLVAVWLGFLSWARPLALPDEGRYPGVAWEMLRSHQFLTPLLNGLPYFHKPPLFYWLAELSMRMFGMNEWAVRVPSLLAAWLALAGLHFFVRAYRGERAARVVTVMLAVTPLYFGGAQYANLDMLVAGMIALCVLAGADTVLRRAQGRPYRAMSLATAALAALAVLSKGLIGLALPGLILALWLALRRDGRGFLALVWPPAIAMFAAVALPWFVLMQMRYPGFFDYFFIYQQFQRFSGTGFNNAQPFWFFVPVLLAVVLPWTLWIRPLLTKAFWTQADPHGLRSLMGLWLAVVVVFFSLPASKLVGYIMPALIPLVFLLAEVLAPRIEGNFSWSSKQGRRASIGLVAAIAICVTTVVVAALMPHRSNKTLGVRLHTQMSQGDTLVAINSYPFDLPFYSQHRWPAWVVGNWKNPAIAQLDNWRKELYDAGRFDPEKAGRVLISPEIWKRRMCAAPAGSRFWIWGQDGDQERYVWLRGSEPVLSEDETRVWRIDASEAFKRDMCQAMPARATYTMKP